ncbi:hypothetical protein B0H19DRAFT_1085354 [Mycena capillaripes]|nr:hypothetical protein B0H19DRAFT_1085354 [Mycena capillaripes]
MSIAPKRQRSQSPHPEEPPAKRQAGFTVAAPVKPGDLQEVNTEPVKKEAVLVPLGTIASLPPELMTAIFDLVVPPNNFLRARPCSFKSKCDETNRAWRKSIEVKMTLIRVCRDWYWIGRLLLYRYITLLDTRSLDLLWWSFHANPDLGQLVHGLSFMFSVEPLMFGEDKSYQDMTDILSLCPRLARVNFSPCYKYPVRPQNVLPPVPSSVTSLEIGSHIRLKDTAPAMLRQTCSQLRELRVPLDPHAGDSLVSFQFSFPHLQTLHLTCVGHRSHRTAPKILTANWKMPQLKRLTFGIGEGVIPEDPIALYAEYSHVLRIHGRELEYLQFPDCGTRGVEEERTYGSLIALCPVVQHVVLPSWALPYMEDDEVFPSVRSLDLWRVLDFEDIDRKHWPNAETIRRLDTALTDIIFDPPDALHPCAQWKKLRWPGVELLNLQCSGISNVLNMSQREEPKVQAAPPPQRNDPPPIPWNGRALLISESDSEEMEVDASDSDDGSEVDDTGADEEAHPAPSHTPALRRGLRRFLQATMPKQMFSRFERAVLGLVLPSA